MGFLQNKDQRPKTYKTKILLKKKDPYYKTKTYKIKTPYYKTKTYKTKTLILQNKDLQNQEPLLQNQDLQNICFLLAILNNKLLTVNAILYSACGGFEKQLEYDPIGLEQFT
jgi:hypothetical protein